MKIVNVLNYTFALVFIFELILKLIGLGPRGYFKDSWNTFDFIITILTVIAEIASLTGYSKLGAAVNFLRIVRIQRLLRYIKRARRIRIIFQTFIAILPSLGSVGALMMLFLYIFSVMGVFLFADVMLQTNLCSYAHFQTFSVAFGTLIRVASGDGWNGIMLDVIRSPNILY